MSTEKTLQAYIKKIFTADAWLVYKFASPSRRGVPDLILISPDGDTIYIEVKHPNGKGKLSVLQKHHIHLIRNNNATVYVIDSKESAEETLELYRPVS
jgi:hypothetical protein